MTGVSAVLKLGGSILYLLLLETRRLCLFVCYLFYIRSRRAAARRSLPQPDRLRDGPRRPFRLFHTAQRRATGHAHPLLTRVSHRVVVPFWCAPFENKSIYVWRIRQTKNACESIH